MKLIGIKEADLFQGKIRQWCYFRLRFWLFFSNAVADPGGFGGGGGGGLDIGSDLDPLQVLKPKKLKKRQYF